MCKDSSLDQWKLFLVDWGYNTNKERQRAAQNPRIEIVDVKGFTSVLAEGKAVANV